MNLKLQVTGRSLAFSIGFFLLNMAALQAQYPYVAASRSIPEVPASVKEMLDAKVERLFQGSTNSPEGLSSSLIIQPIILLNDTILPSPSTSGRRVNIAGKVILQILSPGDHVILKSVEVPLFGKGGDAESALRQSILELEANPSTVRSAYDDAYTIQVGQWNDCVTFLALCQKLADEGKLAKALVKLGSTPPGTPCSREADKLWESLVQLKKKKRCEDMVIAAKTAIKEADNHRALQLAIASDTDCQPDFWKGVQADLATKISETDRADRRFLDKAIQGSLRPEDRKNKLFALLFDQVEAEYRTVR
ncbi:MAG: hypothetical protein IPJ06_08750 [Saprospiraceae bacterium]|nr:hypothetical protein [Saprospiraceae bacterium]